MKSYCSYAHIRRISQIISLLLFIILFRLTDYSGSDDIPYAVNIFFRLDPLVAAAAMLASKKLVALMYPALITLVITIIFGRVFCGWFCPLGTILDGAGRFIRPMQRTFNLRHIKYALLIIILASAMLGPQLIGFFDPFAILVRAMAFSLDPALNLAMSGVFDNIYHHGPDSLSKITEPVYSLLKSTLLPYRQSFYSLGLLSFILLAIIIALERVEKRFWCSNLCPLGALLAVVSRFSFLKRSPVKLCADCGQCADMCRIKAFDGSGRLKIQSCTLCMDCVDNCPDKLASLTFRKPAHTSPVNISRRTFVGSGITALVLSAAHGVPVSQRPHDPYFLRPPGSMSEKDFLALCARCGECMKVCIQNALQPAFLESGIEGIFTPRLVPRTGYCEFNCTLCGQVCATGAIKKLTIEQKHAYVIGRAQLNEKLCLPYAKNSPCIVCEEHCPTYDKAIKFRKIITTGEAGERLTLERPYVIDDLCIGCGICEKVCPVEGEAAVRVKNIG